MFRLAIFFVLDNANVDFYVRSRSTGIPDFSFGTKSWGPIGLLGRPILCRALHGVVRKQQVGWRWRFEASPPGEGHGRYLRRPDAASAGFCRGVDYDQNRQGQIGEHT